MSTIKINDIKNAAKLCGCIIRKAKCTLDGNPAYRISKCGDVQLYMKIRTKEQMVNEFLMGDLFTW